mgnify:CR=1 FL=1
MANLAKAETAADRRPLYLKLVKRALLLVLLGFVYNHLADLQFATQRYASVLRQIGLAYLFAALIMLKVRSLKGRLAALVGILAGYAALQLLVPVPGIGAGVLTPEGTINGWIDRLLLPGRLYDKVFDPEGILCILSATSVTLMGGLAGLLLRSGKLATYRKAIFLAAAGLGLTVLGYVLGGWYPIVKKAWTATFDIYAAGLSLILLALFYLVNTSYSLRLKHVVILDVLLIAVSFVLRAIAGVMALRPLDATIEISPWLLVCTLFLALFLGLGKRRH